LAKYLVVSVLFASDRSHISYRSGASRRGFVNWDIRINRVKAA